MIVKYRGIYSDRFDTPFGLAALLWAKDCHYHCPGCCHEDRRDLPILEEDSKSIINKVKSNPFNAGIALGGYEWTEQYDELISIIEEAREQGLEVILFTHHTEEELLTLYPKLFSYKGLYIKCGEYDENQLTSDNIYYGVPLASKNQYIIKIGEY